MSIFKKTIILSVIAVTIVVFSSSQSTNVQEFMHSNKALNAINFANISYSQGSGDM